MSGNLPNSLRHLSESPPTAYCSSQLKQGTYLIRLNFVSGNFLISHPDFIFIIFYCFYHVYRVKCLKHCKKCSVGITKKTIISVLWYNSLTAASLLSVQFSISLPYFEIVTKFLQLLCVFMILLFLNNVNIFVAYFFFYRENLIFSTKAAEEKIPSTSDTILPAVLELYNPTLSDVIL